MHDVKVTQSERYALEKIEGSIELIITNVTETDAGIYICQLNSEPIQNHVGTCLNMNLDGQNQKKNPSNVGTNTFL